MLARRHIALLTVSALSISLAACGGGQRQSCVDRAPSFERGGTGYELLDFGRREVWATTQWTPDEFKDFAFPMNWAFWGKNDPRVSQSDGAQFMRSPGCEADGQYSYMRAFGREFVQVVELQDMKRLGEGARKVTLEKYHRLQFEAGRRLTVLSGPDANQYVCFTETLGRSSTPARLPEGWVPRVAELEAPLSVELFGDVIVIRLSNEDSCQGPIPSLDLETSQGVSSEAIQPSARTSNTQR